MIFLRKAYLAFLMSARLSAFLVASTLIFSAPRDFLILRLSSFSAFLLGFFLGKISNRRSL